MGQLYQYRKLKPLLSRLPIKLNPKQIEQIAFEGEDALLGGAAGGGKTVSLLVWLLEGIDIPGYNAAIFRKYQTDTKDDESALIAKAAQIYPALGGKLVGFRWMFPAGSSIVMEGIAHENALLSKQGKEYHRVAFDERTHFSDMAYDFITTHRMRKVKSLPIKCGVRSSANPGGPFHTQVKDRYITDDAIKLVRALDVNEPTPYGMIFYKNRGTPFETAYIPSRAADNPNLDVQDYIKRLSKNRNPVERARMMHGDWGVAPQGLIKSEWLRYYSMRGRLVQLLKSYVDHKTGNVIHTDEIVYEYDEREEHNFITIDTAGGVEDIEKEHKGKPLSYTALGHWSYKRYGDNRALRLKRVKREVGLGYSDMKAMVRQEAYKSLEINKSESVPRIYVENKAMGMALVSDLAGELPIEAIGSGIQCKNTRNAPFTNMMSEGQVYLPQGENSWRLAYESELLSWQGLKEETNDQIDISGYAAIVSGGFSGGIMRLDVDPSKDTNQLMKDLGFTPDSRYENQLMKGWA